MTSQNQEALLSILADESVDFRIIRALRKQQLEVFSITELNSGITDQEVIDLANRLDSIILTEDTDFGELTYRLKKVNNGIVLYRLSGEDISAKIELLTKVILDLNIELRNKFTVITPTKIRIREVG